MNLSQLYYFRKLAELQHYAKAAKELYITQPSLSNAISSLEQELGVSLFQKTGRNIHLTKYGAEFLAYVNKGLEQIDKGIAIMKNYAGTGDGGKIDLGCIITVQTDFIPKLLNGYKAAVGGVAFNVREDTSIPLVKDLLSGCYDVVFCAKGNEDPDLAYVPVLTQKVVVAMSSDCPLVEKEFVTPTDLLEQHLITTSTPSRWDAPSGVCSTSAASRTWSTATSTSPSWPDSRPTAWRRPSCWTPSCCAAWTTWW